jgi:hypothetical protein
MCSSRALVNLKNLRYPTSSQTVTANESFGWAKRLSQFSSWTFFAVAALSVVLLLIEDQRIDVVIQPVLIVASIAGIGLSLLTQNL